MSSREASSLEYTYVALASDNATTSQEDQRRLRIAIVIDEDPVSKGMMGKQGTELGYVRKRTGTCLLLRRFQLLVAAVNVDSNRAIGMTILATAMLLPMSRCWQQEVHSTKAEPPARLRLAFNGIGNVGVAVWPTASTRPVVESVKVENGRGAG